MKASRKMLAKECVGIGVNAANASCSTREMRWPFSGETEWKKAFFSLFFKLREGGNEEPVLKRHDPTFSKHIQYDIQNMVNLWKKQMALAE